MDQGWQFRLGNPAGVSTIPHGSPVLKWRWKADDRGSQDVAEMAAPGLDTSGTDWRDAAPGEDTFQEKNGLSWYRATLGPLPAAHRSLFFQSVDDNGTIYLNGRQLLHHEGWNDSFQVSLDQAWRADGPNELAVLVENVDGPGGIGTTMLCSGTAQTPADSPASPAFNATDWRRVDLPHDFVIEGCFDPSADGSHGYLPKGIGWYRRTFTISKEDKGRRLWVEFEAVYRDSQVWLNGVLLGTHSSGYTGFRYDVTDAVNYGGRNVLAVRADATRNEGWWYEGGGIYRHTWLVKTDPVNIAPWGVFVTSKVEEPISGASAPAEVRVQTTLSNDSASDAKCTVESIIQEDGCGTDTGEGMTARNEQTVPAGAKRDVTQTIEVPHATL